MSGVPYVFFSCPSVFKLPPHGDRSVHKENVKERPCIIFVQKVTVGSCWLSFDYYCPDSVAL